MRSVEAEDNRAFLPQPGNVFKSSFYAVLHLLLLLYWRYGPVWV
jgi:hypothetical protein